MHAGADARVRDLMVQISMYMNEPSSNTETEILFVNVRQDWLFERNYEPVFGR